MPSVSVLQTIGAVSHTDQLSVLHSHAQMLLIPFDGYEPMEVLRGRILHKLYTTAIEEDPSWLPDNLYTYTMTGQNLRDLARNYGLSVFDVESDDNLRGRLIEYLRNATAGYGYETYGFNRTETLQAGVALTQEMIEQAARQAAENYGVPDREFRMEYLSRWPDQRPSFRVRPEFPHLNAGEPNQLVDDIAKEIADTMSREILAQFYGRSITGTTVSELKQALKNLVLIVMDELEISHNVDIVTVRRDTGDLTLGIVCPMRDQVLEIADWAKNAVRGQYS